MARRPIVFGPDDIPAGLRQLDADTRDAIEAVMDYQAPRLENIMKTNAPWTDRTSNARNGLAAQGFRAYDEFGIVLFHQVPYGKYLETRWSGRYAIIMPTIINETGTVLLAMQDLLGRL